MSFFSGQKLWTSHRLQPHRPPLRSSRTRQPLDMGLAGVAFDGSPWVTAASSVALGGCSRRISAPADSAPPGPALRPLLQLAPPAAKPCTATPAFPCSHWHRQLCGRRRGADGPACSFRGGWPPPRRALPAVACGCLACGAADTCCCATLINAMMLAVAVCLRHVCAGPAVPQRRRHAEQRAAAAGAAPAKEQQQPGQRGAAAAQGRVA